MLILRRRLGFVLLCATLAAACGPTKQAKLKYRPLLSPKDEQIRLNMAEGLRRYQQIQSIKAQNQPVPAELTRQFVATPEMVEEWEQRTQEILVRRDRTEDLVTAIETSTVLDRNGNTLSLSSDVVSALRLAMKAVAILVPCTNLRSPTNTSCEMCATTFQASQPLCRVSYAKYFGNQPIPVACPARSLCNAAPAAGVSIQSPATSLQDFACTAFLVASTKEAPPSALLTAAHCVSHYDYQQLRAVFGFTAGTLQGQVVSFAPPAVVSFGAPRLPADPSEPGSDWALLPIEHLLTRPPLVIQQAAPSDADQVYLVGHPLGLPMKVDWDGALRGTRAPGNVLSATLDVFQGESGAPVLSASTHQVVALVSDTGADFDPRVKHTDPNGKPCRTLFRCTAADCRAPVLTSAGNRTLLSTLQTLEKEAAP